MIKDLKEAIDIINVAIKEGRIGLTTEEGKHYNHILMQDNGHHVLLTIMNQDDK